MKLNKPKYACIDIGGTNIRFGILENEKIIVFHKFDVDKDSPQKTLIPIIDLLNENQIDTIGVACPGPADYDAGKIINPPNMPGWHNFNLKAHLQANTSVVNAVFENDANISAYGIHKRFHQTDCDCTQFFTVSTGLGAGAIVNGKILVGANHLAQEIAKMPTSMAETPNYWNFGPYALELFSAGSGLERRAHDLGLKNLTAKQIFAAYELNQIAKKIIDEGIESLARLIGISLSFLAPNLMVFGGSVAIHNQWYIQAAIKQAKNYAWSAQYENCRFVFDDLGDHICLIGLNYWIHDLFN